jgi:hypothetical protein
LKRHEVFMQWDSRRSTGVMTLNEVLQQGPQQKPIGVHEMPINLEKEIQ